MLVRGIPRAFIVGLVVCASGRGQTLPTSATIDTIPLELTMPERYHVIAVLEPVRRVTLVAPTDGMIRSLGAPLGSMVRAGQEVAQLDRTEANARLRVAQAEVKEKQALLRAGKGYEEMYKAQLEAAEARAELAQLALSRLTLQAPFAGRIVAVPVSTGQYVLKGTVLAELADLTSLKALVPVDRKVVTDRGDLKVFVEEKEVPAKVQTVLPLPESFASLRELAAPFAAAWITIPNTSGELAAGLRVRSSSVPSTPLATIPGVAVKAADPAAGSTSVVQVIRSEYVTNIPVRVLGGAGADRVQVAGAFRGSDALIVSSSSPLLAGTLVRFSKGAEGRGVEGVTPNPAVQGQAAGIVPPARPGGPEAAPAGAANFGPAPPSRPAPAPAAGSPPF
jgi:multidrug efflux pump subunit AcrA (membrane-fusion protein)